MVKSCDLSKLTLSVLCESKLIKNLIAVLFLLLQANIVHLIINNYGLNIYYQLKNNYSNK